MLVTCPAEVKDVTPSLTLDPGVLRCDVVLIEPSDSWLPDRLCRDGVGELAATLVVRTTLVTVLLPGCFVTFGTGANRPYFILQSKYL